MNKDELLSLRLKHDWKFLFDWNEKLLSIRDKLDFPDEMLGIDAAVIDTQWLGYNGISENRLAKIEDSLSIKLPLSYKEFLRITNGWRYLNENILKVLCDEEIDWFYKKSAEEYNLYTESEFCVENVDLHTLKHTLQITEEIGYEMYTYHLNPFAPTSGQECEAWSFWKYQDLDIHIYPSFYCLMQNEYNQFCKNFNV